MSPILFLIVAYFFISLAALTDKFLLSKALPHPVVYAFLICLFGGVAFVFIPFGFNIPDTLQEWVANIIAGVGAAYALYFLFTGLHKSEISRVFTSSGALTSVFTFGLSFIFLGERLSAIQIIGFTSLVVGGILISLEFGKSNVGRKGLWYSVLAAMCFAASYTATKHIYSAQGFFSGFVWIRIFAILGAFTFLLKKQNREVIVHSFKEHAPARKLKNQLVLFGGQFASAIGFLVLNYVISLTSASLALAAQGLQYLFLLVFTTVISVYLPRFIKERINPTILIQKSVAIFFIIGGLVALSFTRL